MPASERMYFFDNFQNGLPAWEPMAGEWEVTQDGDSTQYTASRREYALSYAGNPNWSNYRVSAQVIIDDDRQGQVGIVGRGDSDHYYFELVLGRSPQGKELGHPAAARAQVDHAGHRPVRLRAGHALRDAAVLPGREAGGLDLARPGRSFDNVGTRRGPAR